MGDRVHPPPQIPVRPGRAVQIQSIDNLKAETQPNDYVDTTTLTTPKLPPRLTKDKRKDIEPKSKITDNEDNTKERRDNFTNEHREELQNRTSQQVRRELVAPILPPRIGSRKPLLASPPPLPERLERDTPTIRAPLPPKPSTLTRTSHPLKSQSSSGHLQPTVLVLSQPSTLSSLPIRISNRQQSVTVNQQPLPTREVTLTMDKKTGALTNSIICERCRQCRCSSCTADRPLPEHWLCEGNCRLSADSVVDVASCMCIAKGLFRRCCDNHEKSVSKRLNPCACTEAPNCAARWFGLAALSLCLPCLCCYWPMQGGVAVATACYNSRCCRQRGCTCSNDK